MEKELENLARGKVIDVKDCGKMFILSCYPKGIELNGRGRNGRKIKSVISIQSIPTNLTPLEDGKLSLGGNYKRLEWFNYGRQKGMYNLIDEDLRGVGL